MPPTAVLTVHRRQPPSPAWPPRSGRAGPSAHDRLLSANYLTTPPAPLAPSPSVLSLRPEEQGRLLGSRSQKTALVVDSSLVSSPQVSRSAAPAHSTQTSARAAGARRLLVGTPPTHTPDCTACPSVPRRSPLQLHRGARPSVCPEGRSQPKDLTCFTRLFRSSPNPVWLRV